MYNPSQLLPLCSTKPPQSNVVHHSPTKRSYSTASLVSTHLLVAPIFKKTANKPTPSSLSALPKDFQSTTCSPTGTKQQQYQYLQTLLKSARPFLTGDLSAIDAKLPSLVSILRSAGTGECWHKYGTFLDHLLNTHRILTLWHSPSSVSLTGLFHSAYSNSYINLTIFHPTTTGRCAVRSHVGPAAERLVHLFCMVPRQTLIHDDLLFHYTEQQLVEDLKASEVSVKHARETDVFDEEEKWRKKLESVVPKDGVIVKNIKTGEDILVSRRLVAVFVMLTIADFSEQFFGFQDVLVGNSNGRLEFSGHDVAGSLWPGDGKPGLWMNSLSRMGAIYNLIVREEEILMEKRRREKSSVFEAGRDEEIELAVPPVFKGCTRVLDAEEQIVARDMYWEAVNCGGVGFERAEELLVGSIEKNPFVGEPHLVLSQVYLGSGRFDEAEREAVKGLTLLLEWGSPWDKRMSWEGWIAWARVLLMKAKEKSWPETSWGILNLGLLG